MKLESSRYSYIGSIFCSKDFYFPVGWQKIFSAGVKGSKGSSPLDAGENFWKIKEFS